MQPDEFGGVAVRRSGTKFRIQQVSLIVATKNPYTSKFLGVELFKFNILFKKFLFRAFGITLPKLRDQRGYWSDRGDHYMETFTGLGYMTREQFFQDLLFEQIRKLEFDSIFEAGCGFGWNIRRAKEEFPETRVGGLDFSFGQLQNAQAYMSEFDIAPAMGDNRAMPFKDNAFDVGFSVGVFMNIHPDDIRAAVTEMIRVSRKYIIHLEYDENHTTAELQRTRAIKTNIIPHDYEAVYRSLGQNVAAVYDYRDFGDRFKEFHDRIDTPYNVWQAFEGPEKYALIVIELNPESAVKAA